LACEALDPKKFAMHRPVFSDAALMRRASGVLAEFGLTELRGELAKNISYGDQRKVEVALSVAGKPRLLLLDEPMAGLSSAESREMNRLLGSLDPGLTVLLIEHDMDVAFGFAEKITVLYQGGVLAQGDRDQVRANRNVQDIYLGVGI